MQGEHSIGDGPTAVATVPRGADDAALVAAVRAGDDAAFEELFRRYNRRIKTFVYGFVRDDGRAEDVTQEAFLSALRRLRETEAAIAFRPWIYEIARNAAIDLHRRNSRAEEVSMDAAATLPPADRRRLVGSTAPENALVDKQCLENLRGALDELSETHHRILVLRELEGRSYREIGARMNLTAPAVESTLFRARRRLEREYSELDTGRRCVAMRSVIARLAEGIEAPRDRRKLERHALRCTRCRRRARELGIEPMRQAGGFVSRAAAFLPLPALLRRRLDDNSWTAAAGSAVEGTGTLAAKAGAVLAAAALAGGGGATLGGVGPLAPDERQPNRVLPAKPPAKVHGGGPVRDRGRTPASKLGEARRQGGGVRRLTPPPAPALTGGSEQPFKAPAEPPPAEPDPTAGGPGLPGGLPSLEQQQQSGSAQQMSVSEVEQPAEVHVDPASPQSAGAMGVSPRVATASVPPII